MRLFKSLKWLVVAGVAACTLGCSEQPAKQPEPAHPAPTVAELIRQADELYARREELDRVREAVVSLRLARTADERNYEVLWRLAKCSHYLGENAAGADERETAYSEGIGAGQAAVRINNEGIEGHYWLGANIAGRTELQSVIGDLAAVGDVRREMDAVIKSDEGFERGGAYKLLGEIELKLPRVMGGDKQRALMLLEKGLNLAPDNSLMRLSLAEGYLAVKRTDAARTELQNILDMQPPPDYLPEHGKAVARARKLLDELNEKGARRTQGMRR